MSPDSFSSLDKAAEGFCGSIEFLHEEGIFKEAIQSLEEAQKTLGNGYSIQFTFGVSVLRHRDKAVLKPITMGFSVEGGKSHLTTLEVSPWKFLHQGQMLMAPHDTCPVCWGPWALKFSNPSCPSCGLGLGEDLKVVLDTDVCPNCERGSVSGASPICDDCGFAVSSEKVYWG